METLEFALDVLLGQTPGVRPRLAAAPLSPPPPLPATGVPGDLPARRPDVSAAQKRVAAADFRVAEAIADRLPRLTIGGAITGEAIPDPQTLIATAVAAATALILDGGVRRATVDLRRAETREALNDFTDRFLQAVADVESALIRERRQRETLRLLESQLAIAEQLLTESRNRYSQGLTDYLPVLNAVVTVQRLQRDVLSNRRELIAARIALHRALGGPMPDAG